MNENTIELQVDNDANVTISDSDLFDGWDDDTPVAEESTESDAAPEMADQPTGEAEKPEEPPQVQDDAPKTEEPKTEEPKPDTDQYLELKHLDEVRKVSKEEARVLAQKGMDYDRIRNRLNDAEQAKDQVNAELQKYKSFLNEVKGENFATVDDLMNDTRARIMSGKENISYEDALAKVTEANQQKAQQQAPQPDRSAVIQEMRKASYKEFALAYPNVLPKDIPQEVWQDMERTNNLLASYERYTEKKDFENTKTELANIKAEIEALKQNKQNEEKAVGSLKTAGSAKTVDKYLEGWDDD